MAIRVSHGSGQHGALAAFAEGKSKKDLEVQRLTSSDRRPRRDAEAPPESPWDRINERMDRRRERFHDSADRRSDARRESRREHELLRAQGMQDRQLADAGRGLAPEDEGVEYRITDKQRAEFNRLTEAYENAVESGDYSEEELKDIRKRIQAKQMGIEPLPHMKEESPWAEGRGIGDEWTRGGRLMTRDPDGKERSLGDDKTVATERDRREWRDQMMPYFVLPGHDPNDTTNPPQMDWDALYKAQRKYFGDPEPEETPAADRGRGEQGILLAEYNGMDISKGYQSAEHAPYDPHGPGYDDKPTTPRDRWGKIVEMPPENLQAEIQDTAGRTGHSQAEVANAIADQMEEHRPGRLNRSERRRWNEKIDEIREIGETQ